MKRRKMSSSSSVVLPYDILDLKDEIKKLKIRKTELINERLTIQKEITVYDNHRNTLQQEQNILTPLDELRFVGDDDANINVSSDPNTDKRHAETDRKLELQILNCEIRAALNSLETEAIRCELQTHKLQVSAEASSYNFSKDNKNNLTFLLKSKEEIENDITNGITARQQLSQALSREVEARRQEKTALSADIGRIREEISLVLDEQDILKETTDKSMREVNAIQTRINLLTKCERELLDQIQTFRAS